jgi:ribonuclease-3
MEHFPKAPEGDLAPRLTALVRREALTDVARAIDLGAYLMLAPADSASGARDHPKMLADACEAVIAALYLDGGLEAARRFIANAWDGMLTQVDRMPVEPKTALQEWAQGHAKALPIYTVTGSSGAAHDPQFEVRVDVDGLDPVVATGGSKRAAEKAAALAMLQRLGRVTK